MKDCIFCKIANNEIKNDILYRDENVIAFNDIDPQAPVHILIICAAHIEHVEDIEDYSIMSEIFKVINFLADKKRLINDGFRIVINSGAYGGQAVNHFHVHLLGGRQFHWPPG